MELKIITKSPGGTKSLGEKLAKGIIKRGLRDQAIVIELVGNLGSGKTTFVQGFAKGASIRKPILSPTFVIFKRFHIIGKFKNLFHFDCYRLKDHQDLLNLEFKNIYLDPTNIVLLEWADLVEKALPRQTITLKFKVLNEKERQIKIGGISSVDNWLDTIS